jgi:RNA-directed DNA polymerase
MLGNGRMAQLGKPTWVSDDGAEAVVLSSGSKARKTSDRNAQVGGGSARSTEEAGQRPRREGVEQSSLFDAGEPAAPEAEEGVRTKLVELGARARREATLTNVVQFVDEAMLRLAFRSLRKQAAAGVDGQSYAEYAEDLDRHVAEVYARLKSGRYRAPMIRRVYIPKANGQRRPLGISTIEDRMVQKAVAWVLSAVFEAHFLDCSHGFRPGRSPHTALHQVRESMRRHRVRYVVEVDLASYFDTVNHTWLRQFVKHRANDGGLLRLLDRWLRAGVLDGGVVTRLEGGVPQGGPISPVLANIYLHYVLDLWFEIKFKKSCRGYAGLVRFADDVVAVFEEQADAERFRQVLDERLEGFGLRVVPEKTRVVHFDGGLLDGRGGAAERPGSFTFLGFVLHLKRSRRGAVTIAWKPSIKARERFVRKVKDWLMSHRHQPVRSQQAHLQAMLNGYYQYFGLHFCWRALSSVWWRVRKQWQWALRRRSQKAKRRCDWAQLEGRAWFQLPKPRLVHGWV